MSDTMDTDAIREDLARRLREAEARVKELEAALRRIADPRREMDARRSVIAFGPFGPAATIREMQTEARRALGS